MEDFVKYAPFIIVVVLYITQQKLFVKPEELERKHREILNDVDNKYVTWTAHNELKHSFDEMKDKIDKIFEFLINKEES